MLPSQVVAYDMDDTTENLSVVDPGNPAWLREIVPDAFQVRSLKPEQM